MIASAVFLLMAAQIEKPLAAAEVPKWSVYELTLTASDREADPYLETGLVGVFGGPNGHSVIVNGFWDGGRTFRLRFAPTIEGTWTYMTVSSDSGMDGQMGTIHCIPPEPGAHGFVRVPAARAADWTFDDGVRATASSVRVVLFGGSAARCSAADCGSLASLERDHLNLALLRITDRAVQDAQAEGTIAALLLFDTFDVSRFDDVQAHRVIDYALARYGAYSNVAWCLHAAPESSNGADAAIEQPALASTSHTWTMIRGVVGMNDPYSARTRATRLLLNECPSPGTTATF
jgi:hypothetical protein